MTESGTAPAATAAMIAAMESQRLLEGLLSLQPPSRGKYLETLERVLSKSAVTCEALPSVNFDFRLSNGGSTSRQFLTASLVNARPRSSRQQAAELSLELLLQLGMNLGDTETWIRNGIPHGLNLACLKDAWILEVAKRHDSRPLLDEFALKTGRECRELLRKLQDGWPWNERESLAESFMARFEAAMHNISVLTADIELELTLELVWVHSEPFTGPDDDTRTELDTWICEIETCKEELSNVFGQIRSMATNQERPS